MRFWDASAIVPLLVEEASSPACSALVREDARVVVWWGTIVECTSALMRRVRDGVLDRQGERLSERILSELKEVWVEILPREDLRSFTLRILRTHPLRASDSLQLGAALWWCGGLPEGREFICLDRRLREAASAEGFTVVPEEPLPG